MDTPGLRIFPMLGSLRLGILVFYSGCYFLIVAEVRFSDLRNTMAEPGNRVSASWAWRFNV
jgi:hypothetical protein